MHAEPVFDCFILRTKVPLSSTQRASENVSFICEQERHGPFGFQSIRDDICELTALDMDVVVLGAPSQDTKKTRFRFCVANFPIALENCLHGRMLCCMIHTRCLLGERKRMRGFRLRSPLEPAHSVASRSEPIWLGLIFLRGPLATIQGSSEKAGAPGLHPPIRLGKSRSIVAVALAHKPRCSKTGFFSGSQGVLAMFLGPSEKAVAGVPTPMHEP